MTAASFSLTYFAERESSISILFPNWDLRTERFLHNAQNAQLYDHPFECPSHAHLNEFYHWRDRLARIHHELQSPGPGWRQLWSDRRNPLQWYTFWFAVAILILTVIFGTTTTVLTFLQTWYTYQGLQLARAGATTPSGSPSNAVDLDTVTDTPRSRGPCSLLCRRENLDLAKKSLSVRKGAGNKC